MLRLLSQAISPLSKTMKEVWTASLCWSMWMPLSILKGMTRSCCQLSSLSQVMESVHMVPCLLRLYLAFGLTGSKLWSAKKIGWQTLFVMDVSSNRHSITRRVLSTLDPQCGVGTAKHLKETAIADTVYAARCTYNSALKVDWPSVEIWFWIFNLPRNSNSCRNGDRIWLIDLRVRLSTMRLSIAATYQPDKLKPWVTGLYPVAKTRTKGTLSTRSHWT